jgi:uncharacterized iron-regulated membrane protein
MSYATWRRTLTRRAIFQLHLWTGLFTGLVMLVLGLSGSMLMLWPEPHVAVAPGARPAPALQEVAQRIAPAPDARLASVRLPLSAGEPLLWRYAGAPGQPGHSVYTHPQTGSVVPIEAGSGITSRQWWHVFHGRLQGGANGRLVVGWFGVALFLLAATGVAIWWPAPGAWRRSVAFERGRRVTAWHLHSIVGFWMCLPIAVLALTGAYFAFPDATRRAAHGLFGGEPAPSAPRLAQTAPLPGDPPLTLDAIAATARGLLPDGTVSMIQFPSQPTAPLTVTVRRTGDPRPRGNNTVYLHPATGAVLQVVRFDQLSAPARALATIGPFHFGLVGGPVIWWAWLAAGIAPAVLFVTGFLVWVNRVVLRWMAPNARARAA